MRCRTCNIELRDWEDGYCDTCNCELYADRDNDTYEEDEEE